MEKLSEDEFHHLFRSKRRRTTLAVLARRIAPVELADLAEAVAEREDGVDATDEESIEELEILLHHLHLPMMADLGVIEYDPETSYVESCPDRLTPDSVSD